MSLLKFLQLILVSVLLSTTAMAQDSVRPTADAPTNVTSVSGALPTDFPVDIPRYPGATVISGSSTAMGKGASFSTSDNAAMISDFYMTELPYQGWTDVKRLSAGPATSITASKDKRRLAIGVTKGNDSKTMIFVGETDNPPKRETLVERDCRAAEPFAVDPIAPDGTVTLPEDLLALEVSHRRNPHDVAISEELAEATYVFGVRLMCTSMAAPSVKYPIALRLLRAASKLNPSHDGAREWVDEIESIYKALGKPVPE